MRERVVLHLLHVQRVVVLHREGGRGCVWVVGDANEKKVDKNIFKYRDKERK